MADPWVQLDAMGFRSLALEKLHLLQEFEDAEAVFTAGAWCWVGVLLEQKLSRRAP